MDVSFLKPFKVGNKIRVGRVKDGGYVVEESSLATVDVIYSYGVGWEVSFEKDIFKHTKKTCRLFDPTMFDLKNITRFWDKGIYSLVKYLTKAALWYPYLFFLRIGGTKLEFYNEGLSSNRANKYDSFPSHIQRFGDDGKTIFLKIDIEGGEYEIFTDSKFIDSLTFVSQLAIEFHSVEQKIYDLKNIICSIGKHLSLVHIHGNNWEGVFDYHGHQIPNVLELTFLNNRFIESRSIDEIKYPIPNLDFPNKVGKADIDLSFLTKKT
jgi:hypothetical protein